MCAGFRGKQQEVIRLIGRGGRHQRTRRSSPPLSVAGAVTVQLSTTRTQRRCCSSLYQGTTHLLKTRPLRLRAPADILRRDVDRLRVGHAVATLPVAQLLPWIDHAQVMELNSTPSVPARLPWRWHNPNSCLAGSPDERCI